MQLLLKRHSPGKYPWRDRKPYIDKNTPHVKEFPAFAHRLAQGIAGEGKDR
jgi:hypothetical protein